MRESYINTGVVVRDQAETLRRATTSRRRGTKVNDITRVLSFTSGKGGVGKTNTVVNIAIALARQGKSVLVVDADFGLANVDVMLGIRPMYTIQHVIEGKKSLEEVIVPGPEGISFIPATSGVESMLSLDNFQRLAFMDALERSALRFDYLLIDTSAGIGSDVLYFNSASSEIVCVVTPEPTSLTDAYALIKILTSKFREKSISVVVNNVRGTPKEAEKEAAGTWRRLAQAVERFLHLNIKYLGYIPADDSVVEAIKEQRAVLEVFPSGQSSLAITRMASKIDEEFYDNRIKGGMQFFFQNLLEAQGK